MKVCFITTVPITIRAFLLKTIEYLNENTDWEIYIICDDDGLIRKELPDYLRYIPIPMKRGISLGGVKAMLEMKRIFQEERFDLIQYSTPNASFYASLAGKKAKIPVRLYCQWGIAYVGFSGIKRSIFKTVEKKVCANSTWIEPDSNSNLEFSISEGLYSKEKASVIWNGSACGVDTKKFDILKKEELRNKIRSQYRIPETDSVFCFVGRVTHDKGVNELLSAFRGIVSERPNTWLFMIGPDEVDDSVDKDLYQWSVDETGVIYTGFTNHVESFLAASDCYVLPSYREGFGMGVVEAEAMGLPVIVTNIPGPVDAMIEGKTGVVVPKADQKALEEAMRGFLSGQCDVDAMGKSAEAFAIEHFEQNEFMRRLLNDRKRLLKKRFG